MFDESRVVEKERKTGDSVETHQNDVKNPVEIGLVYSLSHARIFTILQKHTAHFISPFTFYLLLSLTHSFMKCSLFIFTSKTLQICIFY